MRDFPVQLVFQGGGAKLVALVAAAQAAYNAANPPSRDQPKSRLVIRRISGTSAGAIAGCMLATNKDPEIFRQSIIGLAQKYWPKINNRTGIIRSSLKAYCGKPLYNSEAYRDFLGDLFLRTANIEHMRDLPIPCLFHATDIRNGATKTYDGTENDHTIAEALFRSSALPFIFDTYKGDPYVDGGLINNFPSYGLSDENLGDILGFGFRKHGEYKFKSGPFGYSKALLFTAMDVATERALEKLPSANVHYIETNVDTLDFDLALKQLENPEEGYNSYKAQARSFLENYVRQGLEGIDR
jgi:predicted acylesterase/phospholipase RssA